MPSGTQFGFPAEHRVKQRRDFINISQTGRLVRSRHFLVITLKRPDGPTRLGITVTRKIGGAVVRNRIKRHLREFFRLDYNALPVATEISVIAKRGAENLSFQDVQRELQSVFFSSREPVADD